MATFTISGAARAVGTSRGTIQRAIKSGRLSATTNEQGERVIDLSELLRVFGPLKTTEQGEQAASNAVVQRDTGGEQVSNADLLALLKAAQERETRLLSLLEAEQQARRELETKLLPAPRPTPTDKGRLWTLLVFLAAALAFAGWHFRAVIVSALTP